uniref:Protein Vpr n=1 Tax=Human immunodeficiency virus type 1 TaxID=11676 RepID=H9C7F3_HV1|nr:vpr protein [Human immunodeficiency virus 1]
MERAPEDQRPPREPFNAWTLELLEVFKKEKVKHFPRPWLPGLGQHIYEIYGDYWAGVAGVIRIMRQLQLILFRIVCQQSRIGINVLQKRTRNGASRS